METFFNVLWHGGLMVAGLIGFALLFAGRLVGGELGNIGDKHDIGFLKSIAEWIDDAGDKVQLAAITLLVAVAGLLLATSGPSWFAGSGYTRLAGVALGILFVLASYSSVKNEEDRKNRWRIASYVILAAFVLFIGINVLIDKTQGSIKEQVITSLVSQDPKDIAIREAQDNADRLEATKVIEQRTARLEKGKVPLLSQLSIKEIAFVVFLILVGLGLLAYAHEEKKPEEKKDEKTPDHKAAAPKAA